MQPPPTNPMDGWIIMDHHGLIDGLKDVVCMLGQLGISHLCARGTGYVLSPE